MNSLNQAWLCTCFSLAMCAPVSGENTRDFRLNYDVAISGVDPESTVRIWVPVPRSNEHQTVELLSDRKTYNCELTTEKKYGNRMFYVVQKSVRNVDLNFSYNIKRKEVLADDTSRNKSVLSAEERRTFLSANEKVPIVGRQLDLLKGLTFPEDAVGTARVLYNRVDEHVRYDKSSPGYGNGDVAWVCDSRFGNCTDFHSLFISWARSKNLPARFEIGFPLPAERGGGIISGYHCWATFFVAGKGWFPVDISEADKHPELKDYYFGNITENRVSFTTGRNIELVPQQAGPPLNYFVYPHVEVDGKLWPRERITLSVSYKDNVLDLQDNDAP